RLFIALVLVADQCLERNFGHGNRAADDRVIALGRAIFWLEPGGFCQDRSRYHPRDDPSVADCDVCYCPGTAKCSARFLPERASTRQRVAAHCAACAGDRPNSRSGPKFGFMDSGLRYGLLGAVWPGARAPWAAVGGIRSAAHFRYLCGPSLFEYFAERLEGGWRSVHRRAKTRCGRCSDPVV